MRVHRAGAAGYTLIEVLVVLGLMGGLFGAASIYRASLYDTSFATRNLVSNLRLARSNAIASGVHYRVVVIGPTTYRIERMKFEGGIWIGEPGSIQDVSLPGSVAFEVPAGTFARFDTRGMLVDPNGRLDIGLADTRVGNRHSLSIWPSGQVLAAGGA